MRVFPLSIWLGFPSAMFSESMLLKDRKHMGRKEGSIRALSWELYIFIRLPA